MPDFRNLTDRLTERANMAERESRFGEASDMQDARAEIERLRAALKRIASDPDVSSLTGNPALWPSTIAADALGAHEQSARDDGKAT